MEGRRSSIVVEGRKKKRIEEEKLKEEAECKNRSGRKKKPNRIEVEGRKIRMK